MTSDNVRWFVSCFVCAGITAVGTATLICASVLTGRHITPHHNTPQYTTQKKKEKKTQQSAQQQTQHHTTSQKKKTQRRTNTVINSNTTPHSWCVDRSVRITSYYITSQSGFHEDITNGVQER